MSAELRRELEAVGLNVKLARVAKGWTQEELAFALGETGKPTDRAYLSRLESGQHNPSAATLIRLARALDVLPADLLAGVE